MKGGSSCLSSATRLATCQQCSAVFTSRYHRFQRCKTFGSYQNSRLISNWNCSPGTRGEPGCADAYIGGRQRWPREVCDLNHKFLRGSQLQVSFSSWVTFGAFYEQHCGIKPISGDYRPVVENRNSNWQLQTTLLQWLTRPIINSVAFSHGERIVHCNDWQCSPNSQAALSSPGK